jgi:hypothetical protein
MHKIALIVALSILFLGCSSKNDSRLLEELKENGIRFTNLQQTKNIKVVQENRIFGFVSLTYLYEKGMVDYEDINDERFIIGIYHQENDIGSWSLRLNAKEPKEIQLLKQDSEYLQNLPLINSWTNYYLVTFEHTKSKNINLHYMDAALGSHEVDFSKNFIYEETKEIY